MKLIFLKIEDKYNPKNIGNKERQDDFFFLFHKQYHLANYLNPKQQKILELRKT